MSEPFESSKTEYTGPIRVVRIDPRDKSTVSEKDVERLARMGCAVVFATFPVYIEDDPNV